MKSLLLLAALSLTACGERQCLDDHEYAVVIGVEDLGKGTDVSNTEISAVTVRMLKDRSVRVCATQTWVAKQLADGMILKGQFADISWAVGR